MFSIIFECCIGQRFGCGQEVRSAAAIGSAGGSVDTIAGLIITAIGILVVTGVIPLGSIAGWTIFSLGLAYTAGGIVSVCRIPLFHYLPNVLGIRSLLFQPPRT